MKKAKKTKKKKKVPAPYVPPPPVKKIIDRKYIGRESHEIHPVGGENLKVGDHIVHTVDGIVAKVEKWENDVNPKVTLDVISCTYEKL